MFIYSPFPFCWRAFGASSWRRIYTWGAGVVPPKWAAPEFTSSFFPEQTDNSPGHPHGYVGKHQSIQYFHDHPPYLPFDKIYFVDYPLPKSNGLPASHISVIVILKGQLSEYVRVLVPGSSCITWYPYGQHTFHCIPFLTRPTLPPGLPAAMLSDISMAHALAFYIFRISVLPGFVFRFGPSSRVDGISIIPLNDIFNVLPTLPQFLHVVMSIRLGTSLSPWL